MGMLFSDPNDNNVQVGRWNDPDPEVIDCYWCNDKNEKIQKALIGDTIQYHLQTLNADGKTIIIELFDPKFWGDDSLSKEIQGSIADNKVTFNIKIKDVMGDFVKKDGDDGGTDLEVYCRYRFSDSAEFTKIGNDSDHYLHIYEVGYLRNDDCMVTVYDSGAIHWLPDNCCWVTKNQRNNYNEDPANWTYNSRTNQKDIGVYTDTYVANFTVNLSEVQNPQISDSQHIPSIKTNGGQKAPSARITRSASGTVQSDRIMTIGIECAASTGLPDGRYKQDRTLTTAQSSGSASTAGGAYVMIAVNITNYILENAPVYASYLDNNNIKKHFKILLENVVPDVLKAMNDPQFPPQYKNLKSMYYLFDEILYGYEKKEDIHLYEIGKEIYRNISKFKKA